MGALSQLCVRGTDKIKKEEKKEEAGPRVENVQ
jgi:hypothetical protein